MNEVKPISLPPRFSERAFRRYESVLKSAVDNHPNEVVVDPAQFGLSLATVEQRLRDAKRSFIDNKWVSTIDRDKFLRLQDADDLQVRSETDGKIHIGRPPMKEMTLTAELIAGPSRNVAVLDFKGLMLNSIQTLCALASERALARPIRLAITSAEADVLFESYDISLAPQPDGTYILT